MPQATKTRPRMAATRRTTRSTRATGEVGLTIPEISQLAKGVESMRELIEVWDARVKENPGKSDALLGELDEESITVLVALGRIVETNPESNKFQRFVIRNSTTGGWVGDARVDGDGVEHDHGVRVCWRGMYEASSLEKPAFAKRVKVKFDDDEWYGGVIANHGRKVEDMRHPGGRWEILFDDKTMGRFDDNDVEVEIMGTQSKRIEWTLQEFYLTHRNGRRLVEKLCNSAGVDMQSRFVAMTAPSPPDGGGEGGGGTDARSMRRNARSEASGCGPATTMLAPPPRTRAASATPGQPPRSGVASAVAGPTLRVRASFATSGSSPPGGSSLGVSAASAARGGKPRVQARARSTDATEEGKRSKGVSPKRSRSPSLKRSRRR